MLLNENNAPRSNRLLIIQENNSDEKEDENQAKEQPKLLAPQREVVDQ